MKILFVTANVVKKTLNKTIECMFQTTTKVMSINDVNLNANLFSFSRIWTFFFFEGISIFSVSAIAFWTVAIAIRNIRIHGKLGAI